MRVLITTAGTGSRLGKLTQYLNKSLISVANKPVLAHLVEKFTEDTEFVIALGYKGNLVQEFLELAYPHRVFHFVWVNPFEGTGSGPGLSILKCKSYLQQPFIFTTCDTIVQNEIMAPDSNWIGYAECDDLSSYRTLEVHESMVVAICEKGEACTPKHKPYIGLAGIKDYELFWQSMENGGEEAINVGEAYGLRSIIRNGTLAHSFKWFDTGNPAALKIAQHSYYESNSPNILEKANEAIWFVGDKVIKFSDDPTFIANRVKRAPELKDFIPSICDVKLHMYSYRKVQGHVLSEIINPSIFEDFLAYCKDFWLPVSLSEKELCQFEECCFNFYQTKTLGRINAFYKRLSQRDGACTINQIRIPALAELLKQIDWRALSKGIPGRFHGDLHFENILLSSQQQFVFLDWRQDFGGLLAVGDIYYDLAKIYHGLILNYELIANGHFHISCEGDIFRYDFHRKQSLVDCTTQFEEWLVDNGYNLGKVRLLCALIFLNIAVLHANPLNVLLFSLGKQMLFKQVQNKIR